MFGYVMADGKTLEKADRDRYQAAYCGLCRRLGERFGNPGRGTLTYDMTFLSILLGSVYALEETSGTLRCPVNPLRQCTTLVTEATDYAADMNVLLAYYQYLDDWQDDKSHNALHKSKQLAPYLEDIGKRWPRQYQAVQEGLAALGRMEKANELNPDLPTNCFGLLMGELFAYRAEDNDAGPCLRRMGSALGRFIYLMDACLDLPADIKKERYNPLVAQISTDFMPVLTLMIGECTDAFEQLPIQRDAQILRNILYSGVWVRYQTKKEGKEKRHDRSV